MTFDELVNMRKGRSHPAGAGTVWFAPMSEAKLWPLRQNPASRLNGSSISAVSETVGRRIFPSAAEGRAVPAELRRRRFREREPGEPDGE